MPAGWVSAAVAVIGMVSADGGSSGSTSTGQQKASQADKMAALQWQYYKDNYQPLESKLIGDATKAGTSQEQTNAQTMAGKNVNDAYASNDVNNKLQSYGLDKPQGPSAELASGASNAGAQTTAYNRQKALGYSKALDVVGIGRNIPAQSMASSIAASNAANNSSKAQFAQQQQTGKNIGAGLNAISKIGSKAYDWYSNNNNSNPASASDYQNGSDIGFSMANNSSYGGMQPENFGEMKDGGKVSKYASGGLVEHFDTGGSVPTLGPVRATSMPRQVSPGSYGYFDDSAMWVGQTFDNTGAIYDQNGMWTGQGAPPEYSSGAGPSFGSYITPPGGDANSTPIWQGTKIAGGSFDSNGNFVPDPMSGSTDISQDMMNYYTQKYQPLEGSLINQAGQAGSPEEYSRAEGSANADVTGLFDKQGKGLEASMQAAGINPGSGAYQSNIGSIGLAKNNAMAGAKTAAANNVTDNAYSKELDVVGLGKNIPAQSAAAQSGALNAATAANQTQFLQNNQTMQNVGAGLNAAANIYRNYSSSNPSGNPATAGGFYKDGGKIITPHTRKFAKGGGIEANDQASMQGKLEGPGTETSDSIPAVIDGEKPAALSSGEVVINAKSVKLTGEEMLKAINEAGLKKRYQRSGLEVSYG